MRPVALLLALLLVAPACGRKKAPPPVDQPAPAAQPPVGPPKINAPKEVPSELKTLVERKWDGIAREGNAFLDKFKEATTARESNDRAAMDVAIEAANRHYQTASEAWAEIAYWPDNELADGKIDEATAEACRKWLDTYNKRVDEWTKKNKGLAQYSRTDAGGK